MTGRIAKSSTSRDKDHRVSRRRNFDTKTGLKNPRRMERNLIMLWTIAIIILALWLTGLLTSYTFGGAIHILVVVAVVVVIIRLVQGRRISD